MFDIIEDEIVALLERHVFDSMELTLRLDQRTMKGLLKYGMVTREGTTIPEDTTDFFIKVAGHRIHLISKDLGLNWDDIDSIH